MFMLNNYMGLSPKQPENHFADKLDLNMYSRGMGALGLRVIFHQLPVLRESRLQK